MALWASSSLSKTRAGPSWTSILGATAERLTTDPSGARLPRSTAMPPVGEKGSSMGRMTELSLTRAPAMFSPTVLPVTVMHSRLMRPALSSSAMTAGTPPAPSRSSM